MLEPKLQRRATSPTISNPPSARLSLFPAAGRATPTLRAGTPILRAPSPLVSNSPRMRSKTAPASSPTHQTFKTAVDNRSKPPSTSVTRQYSESPSLKPQQPALTPTSIHSFDSDNESITIIMGRTTPTEAKTWRAQIESQEPEWEILPKSTPPLTIRSTSASLERSLSRKQPRITAASALSSHPSSEPLEVSSPLQSLQTLLSPPLSADSTRQTAAERPVVQRTMSQRKPKVIISATTATVGIARSVSVSKAMGPKTLGRMQTGLVKDSTVSERSPERKLGQGMALTPTLVEIGNRKSQKVQLVDV